MELAAPGRRHSGRSWERGLTYVLLFGLYLSLRGYHSFDGDQAYRLPLLLHRQDPGLFADDPFVRSFDQFNPHRGSLALLDLVSRAAGLPLGLFLIFGLTFVGTCRAASRLATATWPGDGPSVGWLAIGLFLMAKAGNIGTNHLFEALVLDRLVALALGWQALAVAIIRPEDGWPRSALWVSLATVVHPSVGLQLAMLLAATWMTWAVLGRVSRVNGRLAWRGIACVGLAVAPGLLINLDQGTTLRGNLPERLFWILSVELQNPQHMLPHLWRMPQWLSWAGYLALAGLTVSRLSYGDLSGTSLQREDAENISAGLASRRRLEIMLVVVVIGLAGAWYAIECRKDIRVTIFQPFRMGTVARGLALILIAGRLSRLWRSGSLLARVRATVLAAGFLGDWLLVVASLGEVAASAAEAIASGIGHTGFRRAIPPFVYAVMMGLGWNFLAHHDTEYGHIPLTIAMVLGIFAGSGIATGGPAMRLLAWPASSRQRRLAAAVCLAWIVPASALLASLIPPQHPASRLPIVRSLVGRCRFYPMPLDDIERLALWCRDHTPDSSRFIGPPGPKTFRLWSRRNLAFNRSGSPYHGAGLADWFARFQDHVDDHGSAEDFVRAYREHRHEFEARYDSLSAAQRAALAIRQGAGYVIARAPEGEPIRPSGGASMGPLELLQVEGRWAAYRVRGSAVVHRQP